MAMVSSRQVIFSVFLAAGSVGFACRAVILLWKEESLEFFCLCGQACIEALCICQVCLFAFFSSHLAASSWNWVVLKCFDPLQESHLVQWIGNNGLYIHSLCLEINFANQVQVRTLCRPIKFLHTKLANSCFFSCSGVPLCQN